MCCRGDRDKGLGQALGERRTKIAKTIRISLVSKRSTQRAAHGRQPTHDRPSAKESVADASRIAKSRKEKERRKAAFSSSVDSDMRVSLRVVNVRIRSRCWIRVLMRYCRYLGTQS